MKNNFTEGKIFSPLIGFALPVLLALFLQAMYGAVDLLVVGQFAETADVSGVATGSMIMHTVSTVITGLTMGITILIGRKIGEKHPQEAGNVIGAGISLFAVVSVIMTALLIVGANTISQLMNAPESAFSQTVQYIQICGIGAIFIVAYNVLGGIFRGIGDSKMPLITVTIACIVNIVGDLLFVAVFKMGTVGAAIATVAAQGVSVLISFIFIKRRRLPFTFSKSNIRFDKKIIGKILKLGTPVALQDLLVGMSFLIIQAIVNNLGVIESAGVGVAEKVCAFIMLVPSAYMQSMSAFVAQNMGAARPDRAKKALFYGIITSLAVGLVMGYVSFFHGDVLSSIFDNDPHVIAASFDYLKAYGIDCLLTAFLFCFIGYYNGCSRTVFVMLQGIFGAFLVRIPVAYFASRMADVTLFKIGLATPASTVVQIVMCLIMFIVIQQKEKRNLIKAS